jgi:hypothetical protein
LTHGSDSSAILASVCSIVRFSPSMTVCLLYSMFYPVYKKPALAPHGSKTQELANSLYVIRPSLTHILARF